MYVGLFKQDVQLAVQNQIGISKGEHHPEKDSALLRQAEDQRNHHQGRDRMAE